MESTASGGIGRAGSLRQLRNVKVIVDIAVRRGRSFFTVWRGRRILSAGHTIDIIIKYDDRQIDVSSACVDQMVAADRSRVAVAGNDDHVQLRICKLHTGRKRDRSAMRGMQGIIVHITRCSG